MGRHLSIFCPCLPSKQRDNLSSRSLYPEQDSSGPEDYTDDDEPSHSLQYHYPRAQLESPRPSPYPNSNNNNKNGGAWSSYFPNGRFSRHTGNSKSSLRKPNPFRTPYRDDDSDDESNHREIRDTNFAPYRDDDSDDSITKSSHSVETRKSTQKEYEDRNALNDPTKIHPRMEFTPYKVQTQVTPSKKSRVSRSLQGKMAWYDDGEYDDAEEVINVDALIAEQERITRELAAQEEALRKEEEEAIVSKRMAAIRAAERRGLLRFEGDQLVIPKNTESFTINSSTNQEQVTQGNNFDRGYSSRARQYEKKPTSSSAASSFVGGIDAFNQELKMMTLDIDRNTKERTCQEAIPSAAAIVPTRTSSTSTSTSTSTWTSNTTQSTRPKTVSTAVSTSKSSNSSIIPSPVAISPREVLNSVASFLKKVDGVIAGESDDSDDETRNVERQQKNTDYKIQEDHASRPQKSTANNVIEEGSYSIRVATNQRSDITAVHLESTGSTCPEDPYSSSTATNLAAIEEYRAVPEKPLFPSQDQPVKIAPPTQERIIGALTSIFNTGTSMMGYFGGASTAHEPNQNNPSQLNVKNAVEARFPVVVDDENDDGIDDYNF